MEGGGKGCTTQGIMEEKGKGKGDICLLFLSLADEETEAKEYYPIFSGGSVCFCLLT